MKCLATIAAGVCGFTTEVVADSPDDQMVTLAITTDCQKIAVLAQLLADKTIDGYDEIAAGFDGVVMTAARQGLSGCCAGCAVLSGIFKAVQVAARVALPKDISIRLSAG